MKSPVSVQAIGGPTLLLEMGGLRVLTDPTFDPPGEYPLGERKLTKTMGPGVDLDAVRPVDTVLLSHDQHPDNLDRCGRQMLDSVPLVMSTPLAASRLPGIQGLNPWEESFIPRVAGVPLSVTAVPAQHGPDGTEHLTGPVTGFVLCAEDLPTVYVSGDNASMDVVDAIADRFPTIDVAIMFAGAARTALLGEAYLTFTGEQTATAAARLDARWIIPAHFNSWSHFSEGAGEIQAAFGKVHLSERLILLDPGARARCG